jgi:hypothetical protein
MDMINLFSSILVLPSFPTPVAAAVESDGQALLRF